MHNQISLLLVILIISCIIPTDVQAQQDVTFFKGEYKELKSQASQENKPYFVYFTNKACAPCRRMKKETFKDAELARLIRERSFIYEADLEYIDNISLAQKYNVRVFPTIILFAPDGRIILKLYGFHNAEKLLRTLSRYS